MRTLRGRVSGDEGQMTLVLVAFMLALFVGASLVVKFAGGERVSAQARTAGDAAALAGLESVRTALLDRLADGDVDLRSLACGTGEGEAADYADRNDGRLADYCYDPVRGRVDVTVTVRRRSGASEEQRSAAKFAVLPSCRIVAPPEPTPTPTPTPTPSPTGTATPTPTPTPTPEPPPPPSHQCDVPGIGVVHINPGHDWRDVLREAMKPVLVAP